MARISPPESATLHKGERRRGNDGNLWVSEQRGRAPYRWYRVKEEGGGAPGRKKKGVPPNLRLSKALINKLPSASKARLQKLRSSFPAIRKLGVAIELVSWDTTAEIRGTGKPGPGAAFVDELWSDFEAMVGKDKQMVIAGVKTFAGEDAKMTLRGWKPGRKARVVHKPGTKMYFQHRIATVATARAVKQALEDAGLTVDWPMRRWKQRTIGVLI